MHAGAKTFLLCFLVCFFIFGKILVFSCFCAFFFAFAFCIAIFEILLPPPTHGNQGNPRPGRQSGALRGFPPPLGFVKPTCPQMSKGSALSGVASVSSRKRRRSVTEPLVFYYKGQMLEGGAVLCCPSKGNVELASWKNIAQPQPANGHF